MSDCHPNCECQKTKSAQKPDVYTLMNQLGEYNLKEHVAYLVNKEAEDQLAMKDKKPDNKNGAVQSFWTTWDTHGGRALLETTEWNKMIDRIISERMREVKKVKHEQIA